MRRNDQTQLSRSGWVRAMILRKPDITLEELQTEFDKQADKLGFAKKERPKDKQALYQGRSQLAKRWGVTTVDELPRVANGDLNMSGMIRLYVDQWPDSNEAEARAYFADDGLELGTGQFTSGKSTYLRNKTKATPAAKAEAQADEPIQGEGPRAGKAGRRAYKRRGKNKRRKPGEVEASKVATYERMEDQLEELIAQATELKNRSLVRDLKMARRRTSAAVISHSD